MNILDILRMASSNLFRNKVRSLLTILAIFIGSFTIILNSGINYGVNSYVDSQVANVGGEGYLEVLKAEEGLFDISFGGMGSGGPTEFDPNATPRIQAITNDDLKVLRSIDGVESAIGLPMVSAKYIESQSNHKQFEVSLQTFPSSRLLLDMATGRTPDNNSSQPEIILAPDFAEALGYTDQSVLGQTVDLGVALQSLAPDAPEVIKNLDVTVVGVQNRSVVGMGNSWVNLAAANAMQALSLSEIPAEFRPSDSFFFAIVEVREGANDEEIAQIQATMRDKGFQAMTIAEQVGMIMSIFDAIGMVLNIFGAIALLAASIGIINTLFMAVQERTKEIGLMKAMGLSNGKIFLLFSAEAIMLGFWGSAVGILVALVARGIGNNIANQTFLQDLPGFTLIEFNAPQIAGIVLLIMFIAFCAGALPARRAARQNPIDALRYE